MYNPWMSCLAVPCLLLLLLIQFVRQGACKLPPMDKMTIVPRSIQSNLWFVPFYTYYVACFYMYPVPELELALYVGAGVLVFIIVLGSVDRWYKRVHS